MLRAVRPIRDVDQVRLILCLTLFELNEAQPAIDFATFGGEGEEWIMCIGRDLESPRLRMELHVATAKTNTADNDGTFRDLPLNPKL